MFCINQNLMKHHAEFMQASVITLKLLMSLMVIHVGLGQTVNAEQLCGRTKKWTWTEGKTAALQVSCFQRSDFYDAIPQIVFSVYEWSTGTLTATEADDSL